MDFTIQIFNLENTSSFKVGENNFDTLKKMARQKFGKNIEKFVRIDDSAEIDDSETFDYTLKKFKNIKKNKYFGLIALAKDEEFTRHHKENFHDIEKYKVLNLIEKLKSDKMVGNIESVDLCFLVDCTGSMDEYIDEVKTIIQRSTEKLIKIYKNLDLRIAFVGYRDYVIEEGKTPKDPPRFVDPPDRIIIQPFTSNFDQFSTFVGNVKAGGGGDTCEDIAGGLYEALKLDWKNQAKALIHICDAPCHGKNYYDDIIDDFPNGDPKGYKIDELLETVVDLNIDYYFTEINEKRTKIMVSEFTKHLNLASGKGVQVFKLSKSKDLLETVVSSISFTICSTQNSNIQIHTPKDIKRLPIDMNSLNWNLNNFQEFTAKCYSYSFTGNLDTFEKFMSPWCKDIDDYIKQTEENVKILFCKVPFNRGNMRFAYAAIIKNLDGNQKCVVKNSIYDNEEYNTLEYNREILKPQIIAKYLADEYKKVSLSEKEIRFVDAKIIKIGNNYYTLEDYIDGSFKKWNNNIGIINESSYACSVDTFAHWSYSATNYFLVVCDLQGFLSPTNDEYILTDPAISSVDKHFIITDFGDDGIKKFFSKHRCNHICAALRLEKVEYQSKEMRELSEKMTKIKPRRK